MHVIPIHVNKRMEARVTAHPPPKGGTLNSTTCFRSCFTFHIKEVFHVSSGRKTTAVYYSSGSPKSTLLTQVQGHVSTRLLSHCICSKRQPSLHQKSFNFLPSTSFYSLIRHRGGYCDGNTTKAGNERPVPYRKMAAEKLQLQSNKVLKSAESP